ncbi:hypothetical protein GCM10010466_30520 [Planomonospora alba]|uniref:MobA-like NTP transferase domain-containing protein n=1 Tax=Planomonospora alba TaxID=161354 RepID=A0ABP6N5U8_9ACTN
MVRHATGAGADDAVLGVLLDLPIATYADLDEILRSVPRDPQDDSPAGGAPRRTAGDQRTVRGGGREP